jgi:hypothetical protein
MSADFASISTIFQLHFGIVPKVWYFLFLIILTLLILYYGIIPFFSEAFRGFPIIRELEIPLNGLRSIRLSPGDYPTLEVKLIFTS